MSFPAIDPEEVGVTGLIWLFLSYGYLLYMASNLISEGSDLLMLVPSMAGLVGGLVLPILGAVPDGAIMLFSGLGSIEKAQETLSVGVGALAGSTIMLMTIPWALAVFSGRVNLENGAPNYMGKPKLSPDLSFLDTLNKTGIAISNEVKLGGIIVMTTSIPYYMIQVPGMFIHGPAQEVAQGEKYWALAGLCLCLFNFCAYLIYQFKKSDEGMARSKRVEVTKKLLKKGQVSLSGAFYDGLRMAGKANRNGSSYQAVESSEGPSPEVKEHLKSVLHEAFMTYDTNKNGMLEKKEFKLFLRDFHESIPESKMDEIIANVDSDGDNVISFDEFIVACYRLIKNQSDGRASHELSVEDRQYVKGFFSSQEEEEQEDLPADISELSPEEQLSALKRRAFFMLTVGTSLAVLFSDPLVGVLDEMASRIGISPFYVAFVLAPLGSNASELIASQYYASKKTRKSISVALTALEGAGAMSNTFCLSIFMGLIFFRGLAWQYTAETISIVAVEYIVALSVQRNTVTTLDGLLVLMVYPLSLVFVATLEALGID